MAIHSEQSTFKRLLVPFILTIVLVIIDQVTKAVIIAEVGRLEFGGPIIEVIGDFLRIIHVRNLGIAFSIGRGLGPVLRRVLFIALPSIVMIGLVVYYFRTDEFTYFQRWMIAGIFGGGVGNIIDRIFRPDGVVDWVDVKFYGIFGWERWPTFNVADASVVVCGILLMISVFLESRETREEEDE
ncbi:MAG: signal peptidase II [Spirochaetales bacterium]